MKETSKHYLFYKSLFAMQSFFVKVFTLPGFLNYIYPPIVYIIMTYKSDLNRMEEENAQLLGFKNKKEYVAFLQKNHQEME